MSALLERVTIAREARAAAQAEFQAAVRRAARRHSLATVGQAAGLTKQAIHYLVKDERKTRGDDR